MVLLPLKSQLRRFSFFEVDKVGHLKATVKWAQQTFAYIGIIVNEMGIVESSTSDIVDTFYQFYSIIWASKMAYSDEHDNYLEQIDNYLDEVIISFKVGRY